MQGVPDRGELSRKRLFPYTVLYPTHPGSKDSAPRGWSRIEKHRPFLSSCQAGQRPVRSLQRLLPISTEDRSTLHDTLAPVIPGARQRVVRSLFTNAPDLPIDLDNRRGCGDCVVWSRIHFSFGIALGTWHRTLKMPSANSFGRIRRPVLPHRLSRPDNASFAHLHSVVSPISLGLSSKIRSGLPDALWWRQRPPPRFKHAPPHRASLASRR